MLTFVTIKTTIMNNKIIFLFVCFITYSIGNAQDLKPTKSKITYKSNYVACWKVLVDPEPNTIKGEWKSYVKENLYFKLKGFGLISNKDVLEAEDVLVEKISSKRLDFFTRIIESDGQTEIAIFAKHGRNSYLNSDDSKKEFKNLRNVLVDFLKVYLPTYYDEKVNVVNSNIDKLAKKANNLEERVKNNKERIAELEKENVDLAQKIEENKLKIASSKQEFIKRDEKRNKIKELLKKI